ncbi:hypothetical protein B0I22_3096 [Epilithonimonas xixisoli]|uniref:Uncharacterized protein n=1 Tax=Epilithonimonas xixisoli TaxID=1476462 RepID=A0A4R8ID87_9FLAO|nr:hypothetical protein B0I22_3096 [Epilithonimonas xixisoli]
MLFCPKSTLKLCAYVVDKTFQCKFKQALRTNKYYLF